jgi:hypothetical protein
MSGYLHRLGAQAIGEKTGVHPPARLSAAIERLAPIVAFDADASSPTLGFRTPFGARDSSVHLPGVLPKNHSEPQLANPAGKREFAEAPSPPPVARAISVPNSQSTRDNNEPLRKKSQDEILPKTSVVVERIEAREHQLARSRTELPLAHPPPQAPRTTIQSRREEAPRPDEPVRAPRRNSELKQAPLNETLRTPLRPRFFQPAAPAPDVHIHIGRVELTALMRPEKPRRENATPAKKPMSLDEYLRRRGGEKS